MPLRTKGANQRGKQLRRARVAGVGVGVVVVRGPRLNPRLWGLKKERGGGTGLSLNPLLLDNPAELYVEGTGDLYK